MDYNWLCDCERFHRRDFVKVGVLGFLGLSLSKYYALADASALSRSIAKSPAPGAPKLAGQTNGTADSAILIWLAGGPSHLDTFDPKPEAAPEIRGTFNATETAVKGIRLSEHLPLVGKQMD